MRNRMPLSDKINVRLIAADVHSVLNDLSGTGIVVCDVAWIDELTVEFTVTLRDYRRIDKQKYDIKIIAVAGIFSYLKHLKKRIVLLIGIIAFVFLSIYIQNHILFIEVSGNCNVPERYISEIAQGSGLEFGCKRKEVRSEYIKNILLENIPQLQWVGINTAGCLATIYVRERTNAEPIAEEIYSPSSIVALKDGVISDYNISSGTSLCQIGDSVTKGQVLISGVSTLGKLLSLTQAKGEVYAQTESSLELLTIKPTAQRAQLTGVKRSCRIIFRKNIINLCKYSGILDSTCVKIDTKYTLCLAGRYNLPITLWCETVECYSVTQPDIEQYEIDWLLDQGSLYMLSQMIAGQITDFTYDNIPDQLGLAIKFTCKEMIGQIRKEELFYIDGKNS